jgi:hypothetical protein
MAEDKQRQALDGLAKVETSTGQGSVKRLSGSHPVVKKKVFDHLREASTGALPQRVAFQ